MSTIDERVAKGAALLDERIPGWDKLIDLAQLDLEDCARCVLGQVFDGYMDGRRMVGWSSDADDDHLTVEHGFAALGDEPPNFDPDESDYLLLAAEWRRVITERRTA